MNPDGDIYMSENVATEDAARLDGYLRGRSEETLRKQLAEAEAKKRGLPVDAVRVVSAGGETPA